MPVATRLAADSLRALPRKRLSRVLGLVADLRGPRILVNQAVRTFCRVHDVDLKEAVIPAGGFATFDQFFTRELRPGLRPVDPDARAVLSPADGRLEDAGLIDIGGALTVKGRPYRVGELLGDESEAAKYHGGRFFIVYLSPRDYHRVHAPATGRVSRVRHVPGTLFPVNAIGVTHVPGLFARNERVAVFQETERHGTVATVMVGAIGVGRIGLAFDDLLTNSGQAPGLRRYPRGGPEIERGEQLGVFHLGSTVIVFVGPDCHVTAVRRPDDAVRVGEAVFRGGGS